MSVEITVVSAAGARLRDASELPLTIGTGVAAAIRVPGPVREAPLALIGALDERPFLQAAGGGEVAVNGEPLAATRWLADGDLIVVAGTRIQCSLVPGRWTFSVAEAEYPTLPPELPGADEGDAPVIAPRAPRRAAVAGDGPAPAGRRWLRPAVGAVLVALLGLTVYLFTARAVLIDVEPGEADVRLAGGLLKLRFGGRYLLWPGDYRVLLRAEGYEPTREEITVGDAASQEFRFVMRKLPGRVVIRTEPPAAGRVLIDDVEAGITPTEALELTAGPHALRVDAERFLPFEGELLVEGRGAEQEFVAELAPAWADVSIASDPPGAVVRADDADLGVTPGMFELLAGTHEISVELDGYKIARQRLTVSAGERLELPIVRLQEADGLLTVTSVPSGAAVSVAGRYRGTTPVEVDLAPGRSYEVIVSKPGFGSETKQITMPSREGRSLRIELAARLGQVTVRAAPADAELLVDGQTVGAIGEALSLPARPHRIEVRKPGFASYTGEITPRPGLPQVVEVRLLTEAEAILARTPATVTTSQGLVLRLVEPGALQMGAPRREQGRRPNESQREVRLTRRFYFATREVTNTEFREFNPKHTSGAEKFRELGVGDHPAVLLSWDEAASFCNWLSDREGLERAYVVRDGRLALASPPTAGYRLPTEAEWAWVARYNAGGRTLRYPWGDSMPPSPNAGNFADRSAQGFVANVLASYDDGYPVTAPVGRFAASPLGIYDLGGNVAEWVHDLYTVYTNVDVSAVDPVGPEEGQYHVIRGSSWRHASISELRLAYRDFGDQGRLDVGFRLARFVSPGPAEE